ncbi:hypothetical protein AV530_008859 [Patagioenas fasciata monilis]|uniref:Uncharacterized protein n=1 Tax=Patagioenas fasciata monilis TaxID=372326 RepID=A0A1V4JGQ0_PATFA|nr:hypothetical protein AV530_008859 [Patagioenas fasciata monilis]
MILYTLCCYGLHEGAVVQRIQPSLEEQAALLVHGHIDITEQRCSEETWRLLCFYAAEENSPAGSPSSTSSRGTTPTSSLDSSSSNAGANAEEQPNTLEPALHGARGRPPSVPVPTDREQPQEELGQAVAAGPSAQGCSRSRSTPGRDRDRSPRDPSADSHEDEQVAVELVPGTYMAGLQPQVWAGLSRDFGEILEPLVSWVNEVLQGPFWFLLLVLALCTPSPHDSAAPCGRRGLSGGRGYSPAVFCWDAEDSPQPCKSPPHQWH